ncbi:MAG: hypothetical protein PUC66_03685, partial [Erysipelotrichaceae bacterium]|nr:hypothetical protein [Erysipelotrichaceae bacterium]
DLHSLLPDPLALVCSDPQQGHLLPSMKKTPSLAKAAVGEGEMLVKPSGGHLCRLTSKEIIQRVAWPD